MRAAVRAVAPLGGRHDAYEVDYDEIGLAGAALQRTLGPLLLKDNKRDSELAEVLVDLERSYLTWKKQPSNARSEIRLSLLELAQVAGTVPVDVQRARLLFDALPDDAQSRLWAPIVCRPDWPTNRNFAEWVHSNDVDWPRIAAVAQAAARRMRGGDVPNLNLRFAVMELIKIFEAATGAEATMARANLHAPRAADFAITLNVSMAWEGSELAGSMINHDV